MEKTINDFLKEYEEGKLDKELLPSERLGELVTDFLESIGIPEENRNVLSQLLICRLEEGGFLR